MTISMFVLSDEGKREKGEVRAFERRAAWIVSAQYGSNAV